MTMSDMDAKAKAQRQGQPRASRPGAVSVREEAMARIDQRIAAKRSSGLYVSTTTSTASSDDTITTANSSTATAASNMEMSDVTAKANARAAAIRASRPGAVSIRDEEAARLDERIARKRSANTITVDASSSNSSAPENSIIDEERPEAPSSHDPASQIMSQEEEDMAIKLRARLGGPPPSQRVADKPSDEGRIEREVSKAEEEEQQVMAISKTMEGAVESEMENNYDSGYGKSSGIISMDEEEDDDDDDDESDIPAVTADYGRIRESDLEFGVLGAPDSDEGLVVAQPVKEEDEHDAYVTEAIEYDPDAKPPLHKNRRFRLYAFLAFTVLIVAAVGAALGIVLTKDNNSSGPSQAAIREGLGIREQVERVVGSENLQDPRSPYVRALNWITYTDPMQLTPESSNFVQRYMAAYFYYATSEEYPWDSCNPPAEGEADDCQFNKLININPNKRSLIPWGRWLSAMSECDWAGVFCDDQAQMRAIELIGANVTGSFPMGIKYMPYLQSLSLAWGELRGTLPSEIAEMSHLINLELHYNALSGKIPPELFTARNLQRLNLGENNFEGPIPTALENMKDLKGFYVYDNHLSGTIPSQIGNLKSLVFLFLNRNAITGSIPTSIGGIEALLYLYVHSNKLTGTLPTEIGNLLQLMDFRANFNPELSGTIPDGLYNLTDVGQIDLYGCNLTGTLSPKVEQLIDLHVLRVSDNNLHGTLPTELGRLKELEVFWIDGNDFTGTVPEQLCTMRGPQLKDVTADCQVDYRTGLSEISCPDQCCTSCCDRNGDYCTSTGLN